MAVPAFPFRKLAKPSLLRLLPVAAFAVGLACFAFRAPLVVVSDAAFETLYGERRAAMSRLALAARALRPVRLAVVADGAAPSAAADVAATAGPAIRVALFPARYAAGAELFASRHPGASTVVIGEGAPFGAGVIVVVPDRATDGYRVGLIAGLSAGARPVDLRADPTSDYLFIEGFRAGLEKSGWKGRFSSDGQGDSPSGAFVVVAPFSSDSGAALKLSWSPIERLPARVSAIVDDSLYALSYAGYRAGIGGTSSAAPSRITVRIAEKRSLAAHFAVQAAAFARRH